MIRKTLVVGDPPESGGNILPYEGPLSYINGHRAALIGGRVYCQGCNSVGIIIKTGGPRRMKFNGAEQALEGDAVQCYCSKPPLIFSKNQNSSYYDDGRQSYMATAQTQVPLMAIISSESEISVAKKTVDELVNHPPEAEQTENICPNMTNKEFSILAMKLRDMAIG